MTTLRIVCDCGAVIRALPENLIRGRFVQCGLCHAWLRLRVDSGHQSTEVAVGGGSVPGHGTPAAAPFPEGEMGACERAHTYVRFPKQRQVKHGPEPLPEPLRMLFPVRSGGLPCGGSHLTDYTPTWERGRLNREQKRILDAMIRMRRESAA